MADDVYEYISIPLKLYVVQKGYLSLLFLEIGSHCQNNNDNNNNYNNVLH